MEPTIVLISCSDHKKRGACAAAPNADSVLARVSARNCGELLAARRQVYGWLRCGRLRAGDADDRRRRDESYNVGLVNGPDLGGPDDVGQYCPAHVRYSDGRFFTAVDAALASADGKGNGWERAWGGPVWTVVVSGLYGMLAPAESIQCYSSHLTDVDTEANRSLSEHWKPVLTEVLLEFARATGARAVVDLLSEDSYRESFDWTKIYGAGIEAYHRCFARMAGPQMLPTLGTYFAREFLIPDDAELPPRERWVRRDYFPDGDEMLFESELFAWHEGVAREGSGRYVPELIEWYGEQCWCAIDRETRAAIAQAEYAYQRNRHLTDFDFAQASILLTKAIEKRIRALVAALERDGQLAAAIQEWRSSAEGTTGPLTLGGVGYLLRHVNKRVPRSSPSWRVVGVSPDEVWDIKEAAFNTSKAYRNDWVHDKPMSRELFQEFRGFTREFFASRFRR